MKKILLLIKEKWAEYLLEILVIIIGIIVAFSLDALHTKNLEKKNLITIIKKTQLNIEPITERDPQQSFTKQIDTILAALDIIETKQTITKQEEDTISRAISVVNLNGGRNYNLRPLEQLIENLPVTEANFALINSTEKLINLVHRDLTMIDQMDQQIFDMMTLLDKEIVWFDKDGSGKFDYNALKGSRQSIDYLIRGRRWKKWIGFWENRIIENYKEVNGLLKERLKELQ